MVHAARYWLDRQPPAVAHVAGREEGLVHDPRSGLDYPRLGDEVCADGHTVEQAEFGEQQRAGALRADHLARRVEAEGGLEVARIGRVRGLAGWGRP